MTEIAAYRRCLRCYPAAFRREHETEILAVLSAASGDSRRQADWRECLALVRGALVIRLRSRIPRSNRSRLAAVKLMFVGAVVELLVGIAVIATMTDLRARVVAKDPAYGAAQWHAEVTGSLHPLVISAAVATIFWLFMAWANGRGHRWARLTFVLFFGLTTFSLGNGLVHGSATFAPQDLAAGGLLWLIQLSTVGLLFHDGGRPGTLFRWRGGRMTQHAARRV